MRVSYRKRNRIFIYGLNIIKFANKECDKIADKKNDLPSHFFDNLFKLLKIELDQNRDHKVRSYIIIQYALWLVTKNRNIVQGE